MALSDHEKEQLRSAIADKMVELEHLFRPNMKLSFFARHPDDPNAHVFVGTDTPEGLRGGIDELVTRCPRMCSDCDGAHHWLESCPDPGDADDVEAFGSDTRFLAHAAAFRAETGADEDEWPPVYVCKHCPAWKPYEDEEDDGPTEESAALAADSSDDVNKIGDLASAATDFVTHALVVIERNFAGHTTPEWIARYREGDATPPEHWPFAAALWKPSRSWQENLRIARDLIDAELARATRLFEARERAKAKS